MGWFQDFLTPADARILPLQLLGIAFTTGILDAVTFPDFGVFVSNQTGNSIFVALAAAGLLDRYRVVNTLTSIFPFIGGLLVFGQIGYRVGQKTLLWLLVTSFFQAVLVLLVGALIYGGVLVYEGDDPDRIGVIVLLAVSSGMQVAMAKTVSVPEVPTAMLTSPYADLFCDPNLFKAHNPGRNKRLAYVVCIFLGSLVGAFIKKYSTSQLAIILAGGLKFAVCLSFLLEKPAIASIGDKAGPETAPKESACAPEASPTRMSMEEAAPVGNGNRSVPKSLPKEEEPPGG